MKRKIYIIACESSGDYIVSKIIENLKSLDVDYEFQGVGGVLSSEQGLNSLFDIRETNIMGFVEILPYIFRIKALIKKTVQDIESYNPDMLITVDSPGFCFRITEDLQHLRENGTKFIHIVAPSVWAYKPQRAEKISKLYDHLMCILDFEPPLFTKYGLKSTFIGHTVIEQFETLPEKEALRLHYNINKDTKIICVTPGSRKAEIQTMLPIFIDSLNLIHKNGYNICAIILVNNISKSIVEAKLKELSYDFELIITEDKLLAFTGADIALAKSGTNVVEISLCKTPVIVAHKLNIISYLYIKFLALIKYVSIVNILARKKLVPELIQNECNSVNISAHIMNMLDNPEVAAYQVSQCYEVLSRLSNKSHIAPTLLAAKIIESELQ